MILYANGCSMVAGYGMISPHANAKPAYNHSWVNLLAGKLNCDRGVYNKAIPGSSNQLAVHRTIKWIECYPGDLSDVFVVFGVTSPFRKFVLLDDDYYLSICYRLQHGQHRVTVRDGMINNDLYTDYNEHLEPHRATAKHAHNVDLYRVTAKTEMPDTLDSDIYVSALVKYLTDNNIKHIIVNCMGDTSDLVCANKFDAIRFIDHAIPPRGADGVHPGKEQNESYADMVYQYIKDNKIL